MKESPLAEALQTIDRLQRDQKRADRRIEALENQAMEQRQELRQLDVEVLRRQAREWQATLLKLWAQHQLLITKLAVTSEAVWVAEKVMPAHVGQVARMLVWAQQLPDETWAKLGKMSLGEVLSEVRRAYREEGQGLPLPEVLGSLAEAVSQFEAADEEEELVA